MLLIAVVGRHHTLGTLGIAAGTGILVFVLAFWGLREAFKRRSGGASFR